MNGLIIFSFSLSVYGVIIVAGLQNCCPCSYFGKVERVSTSINSRRIFTLIEPLTQLERKLEITTDQGDDIHWAGNNKRHEANHLNFLGLTKIVRIDNININNKSLSLLHNKESNFSE